MNVTRLSIVKFFELLLVCIILILHWNSHMTVGYYTELITVGTIGGYLIILIGLFAGAVMGTPVNRRVDLFFSLIGCALFIISGVLIIDHYRGVSTLLGSSLHNTGIAKGSMCIIEAVLFVVDAFLTFRGEA